MNRLMRILSVLVIAAECTVSPAAAQDVEAHALLDRMAGEWTMTAEAIPGPGMDPVATEGRENARLVGRWLVAESTRSVGERTMTAIMTLGYDAAADRFVGTWIDEMQAHLWSYEGTLDESGTAIVLETEGPILGNPERTTRYREIIELGSNDQRVMRSFILGPNGEWFEYGRAEYRRAE